MNRGLGTLATTVGEVLLAEASGTDALADCSNRAPLELETFRSDKHS